MHKFDYSFLDNGLLPTGILNLTSTISALKALANERKDKNLQVYTQLESIARVQSVKNSNAIISPYKTLIFWASLAKMISTAPN